MELLVTSVFVPTSLSVYYLTYAIHVMQLITLWCSDYSMTVCKYKLMAVLRIL